MFWGLLVAVVGAVFAFTREGFARPFTDFKILVMVAGVVVAWYWREGKQDKFLTRASLWYGLFLLPPLMLSKSPWMSLFGFPGVYYGSALTAALCISGLLLASRLNQRQRDIMRRVIYSSCVLLALVCLAQASGRDPFRWPMGRGDRVVGLLGSPIDSGAMLLAAWSLHKNPIYLGAMCFTGRGPILGAAVAMLPVRLRTYGFILATIGGMVYTANSPEWSDRVRVGIWKTAAASESWIGAGPANFSHFVKQHIGTTSVWGGNTYTAHSHNAVLEAWATRGVFGLMGLAVLLLAPEMAGIYTVTMFNPVSFEVIFIACVLVGLRKREGIYA